MAQTNPALPSVGAQRGDNEVVVRADLVAILAELNGNLDSSNIRDGSIVPGDLATLPQVRASGPNQNIAAGANLAILLDNETYDLGTPSNNMHDAATNNSRMTCRVAGLYHVEGVVSFSPNGSGSRAAWIQLNGVTRIAQTSIAPSPTGSTILHIATDYRLAANDYVELLASQDSGTNLTIEGLPYAPVLSAHFVSP